MANETKREYLKRWFKENPEKRLETNRRYMANRLVKDPDYYKKRGEKTETYRRNWRYKKLFGITVADYDRMYDEQGGKCALCGEAGRRSKRGRLCVDHDHVTGKARQLLCNRCNVGLGWFEALQGEAIDYLAKHARTVQ